MTMPGGQSTGTGFHHFWNAMRYTMAGFGAMLRETAFRQELAAAVILFPLPWILHFGAVRSVLLNLLWVMVMIVVRRGHILDDRFAVVGDNLRADGNFDDQVFAFASETVFAFAVVSAFRFEMLLIAEIDQRIQIRDGFKNHVAAASAVPAVRSAEFDILFATKRATAVAPVAGFKVNLRLIQKFHRFVSPFLR